MRFTANVTAGDLVVQVGFSVLVYIYIYRYIYIYICIYTYVCVRVCVCTGQDNGRSCVWLIWDIGLRGGEVW